MVTDMAMTSTKYNIVMKEDVDTLKDDWLTDNVSSPYYSPCLKPQADGPLQSIAFWEEYIALLEPSNTSCNSHSLTSISSLDTSNVNTSPNIPTPTSSSYVPPCLSCSLRPKILSPLKKSSQIFRQHLTSSYLSTTAAIPPSPKAAHIGRSFSSLSSTALRSIMTVSILRMLHRRSWQPRRCRDCWGSSLY